MGLWDEFAATTPEQWRKAILAENKGESPKNPTPFYTRADTQGQIGRAHV